jgi:hypothetical protein
MLLMLQASYFRNHRHPTRQQRLIHVKLLVILSPIQPRVWITKRYLLATGQTHQHTTLEFKLTNRVNNHRGGWGWPAPSNPLANGFLYCWYERVKQLL